MVYWFYDKNHIKTMLEIPEVYNLDGATSEELGELIEELITYRNRLEAETLAAAQKAKVTKQQVTAHLTPILTKLDRTIAQLQERYGHITS
jgi:flagellar biosynthesis chaperone FliJ